MSHEPSSQAALCQPTRLSNSERYPALTKRLSRTVAWMNRVEISTPLRIGSMNIALNQEWPILPGLVVKYLRGRQPGFELLTHVEMSRIFRDVNCVASSISTPSYCSPR